MGNTKVCRATTAASARSLKQKIYAQWRTTSFATVQRLLPGTRLYDWFYDQPLKPSTQEQLTADITKGDSIDIKTLRGHNNQHQSQLILLMVR